MAPVGALLWRHLRIFQIYGANTDVGKTVLATSLCQAAKRLYPEEHTHFLKPVSTGPPNDADSQHVVHHCPGVTSTTLVQYDLPVSPHAAASRAYADKGANVPRDNELLTLIRDHCARAAAAHGWLFLETAGGVHSPAPSGTTQAELYSELRLPLVLVGDAKLGGISLTISAFEALRMRGYDVELVLMLRNEMHQNHVYLRDYLGERFEVPVVALEAPPDKKMDTHKENDRAAMRTYYERVSGGQVLAGVLRFLKQRHAARIKSLESMAERAHGVIWWPFTQQKMLSPKSVTAIDSARGDFFQTLTAVNTKTTEPSSFHSAMLRPSFDGSASWWTQGLGHGSSSLTLAAAYAAGRYGHVMFAEAVHEPALQLAETLVGEMKKAGNSQLSRVFFSDNGSTGIEVALKMALRAGRVGRDAKVLALKGGYHGDTLGAMDCSEPGVYNSKVDWYRGRGVWLDYPTVMCKDGKWTVDIASDVAGDFSDGRNTFETMSIEFDTLGDIFDLDARKSQADELVRLYETKVRHLVRKHELGGDKIGALLIEPVVIGAGGMLLVDPLFQHTLVNYVRRILPHVPIIFDEVFTGLYRLGQFTSSSLIAAKPDISVHAKLLTGGLVPLCATLATESVFEAFASDDKTDALLHGHSYTAHAVGCQVALESLRTMRELEKNGAWRKFMVQGGWTDRHARPQEAAGASDPKIWSIWSDGFVRVLSRQGGLAGAWALGSVLAVHMKAEDGAGYTSTAAVRLREALKEPEEGERWNVHSRVLGNVLYIIGSQKATVDDVNGVAESVMRVVSLGY